MFKNKYVWSIFLGVCMLFSPWAEHAHAQRVAIKTNALYWAGATPNLGLEFRLSRHFTLGMEGAFNRFKISKIDTRMIGCMPELRYWFSGRPHAGHQVGVMGLVGDYRLNVKDSGHEGSAYGFGPTYAYSWVLSRRWSMEANVGVGLLRVNEKVYTATNMETYPSEPNNKKWLLAPLRVGLTFVYLIK